jgi:hypothetical protein
MAEKLELGAEYTVEKENGFATIKVTNEHLFVEKAKEAGIEKKTLEQVSKFREAYLNAAVEEAAMEAKRVMEEDKDIKEAEVDTPNGIGKSSKIKTYVLREKTMRVPGPDNKTITKTVIKNVVESREFLFPKSKRKELENKLTEALLNV